MRSPRSASRFGRTSDCCLNVYQKFILPRLIDLAMRHREASRYRAEIVPRARGVVVELGIGSGLNLPFYGPDVQALHAVDPSQELLRMARKKAHLAPFPVELHTQGAESLPLEDACADTVVTTFSLCTIPDPLAALREARRVLKPGGMLIFAEHGLAPEPSVQRWQHRCNPIWKRIAGGCNLDRPIDALIGAAGFRLADLRKEYARGPRAMSYIYAGAATRPITG